MVPKRERQLGRRMVGGKLRSYFILEADSPAVRRKLDVVLLFRLTGDKV